MKHTMRTALALLLVLVCVFAVSCGADEGKTDDGTPATMEDVYNAVTGTLADSDKLVDIQDSYLKNFIKADTENYASYKVVVQSISSSIDEIGIFEAKDAADVKAIEDMVDTYLDFYRNEIWDNRYNQDEFPKLRDAERVTAGNFVMYVILGDAERAAAVAAFENAAK